jgi:hypothetical protein
VSGFRSGFRSAFPSEFQKLFPSQFRLGFLEKSFPNYVHLHVELVDESRFRNGVVHIHYRTTT